MAKITIEYCSQYKSYNGKEVNAGECLAPVVFSEEMLKSDDTINHANIRTWKRFGVSFKIGFMVVKEEDFPKMLSLYYSCINDYFNEHPEHKPGRCVMDWDEYSFPILCSKDHKCQNCPHRYENRPRYRNLEDFIKFESLDTSVEDADGNESFIDIADTNSIPVEDFAILGVLFSELMEHLEKIDVRYAKVAKLKLQHCTNKEIFDAIGLKSSHGYDVLHNAEEEIRKFLQD